jgi:hypothetical protein
MDVARIMAMCDNEQFTHPEKEMKPAVQHSERKKMPDPRIPAGCAIAGIMDISGKMIPGEEIMRMVAVMHDRSNGLGGGFAGYGIYPEHSQEYCFHVMCDSSEAQEKTEVEIAGSFEIVAAEEIPTEPVQEMVKRPLLWRYFLRIQPRTRHRYYEMDDDDIVMMAVMVINEQIQGAFMDGPVVEVFGNGQDAIANTMNNGRIVIHGDAGDVLAYAMRGGALFVRGSVGYRVGIHMKAFRDLVPILVVGGTAKDFLGEYMAGGILAVLALDSEGPPRGTAWGAGQTAA